MTTYTFADAARDSRDTTKRRLVYVIGCDDATAAVMNLTDTEYALVQRIAKTVNDASVGSCQPTIETDTDGGNHYGWPDPEENL